MNLFSKFLFSIVVTGIFLSVTTDYAFAENPRDINRVKKNIESVKKELEEKQKAQKETAQMLKRTKEILQENQKELMQLNRKHKEAWTKLQKLRQELEALATQIKTKQNQLARLLFLQNKRPHQDALVVLLKNENPNQKGRDLTYLRYIAQANQKVVSELKGQQAQLAVNEALVNEQLQAINKVMREKQVVLKGLKGKNVQALNEHDKITRAIDTETRKLANLRSSEQQLAQLTRRLAQKSQPPKKRPKLPKPTDSGEELENTAPEDMTEEINVIAVSASTGFSRAKGRLTSPTQGRITGRFGTKQSDGSTWKGIFISTDSGQGVRSVYAGKVIYIGQVGSFGNTIIIDHGDSYVTVYMGLSAISAGVNSNVKAGQRIGSTGQDDLGQSGLYFQIRYLSQPVNPSSWLG